MAGSPQGGGAGETMVKHKQVVLASLPKGMVKDSNFRIDDAETHVAVQAGSGDVAVKLLYIGVEPYYRELMVEEDTLGFGLYTIGQPIWGNVVAEVVKSANPEFKEGDTVQGNTKFAEYVVVPKGQGLQKIDASLAPPSHYLGILGMPGFTAWVGLKLIGKPKSGEQVFVSAASGAVGQIVGQLAKVYGCRVVGSAGSDEKVKLLTTEFGYDDAINYKTEKDLPAALKKHFPDGIDIYFDNVGGETLDAVLKSCNMNARIALCGAISQYNLEEEERYGMKNLFYAVGKCIKMEGFVVGAFNAHKASYVAEMRGYTKEGKVNYKEHVTHGIAQFPAAFVGLMNGHNVGKSVIQV